MSDFLEGGNFDKYFVLKRTDIDRYLDPARRGTLLFYGSEIEAAREAYEKKQPNKYLVINVDEPYAPEIVAILKNNGHWG